MVNRDNVDTLTERVKEIRRCCIEDATAVIAAHQWDAKKDLRITSIKRIIRLIIGLNVSFLYLSNSDQNAILEGIRLPFEKDVDIEQYLLPNEIFLKAGFASSLFSIVEGILKGYWLFLDEEGYKQAQGNKHACNCLVEEILGWETAKFDCRVFDLLRLIRNTLHSNGIHLPISADEKNVSIKYKQKMYHFVDGARIDFITWDLLLDITDDMRILLFQLSNSKTMREIQGTIPDRYLIGLTQFANVSRK